MGKKVVHCKRNNYDVYIGRGKSPLTGELEIWGNPFTFKDSDIAQFKVKDRKEAISSYKKWVVDRQEIIDKVYELKGKTLGCWCDPFECHGEVLVEMSNNVYVNDKGKWELPSWLVLAYRGEESDG